MDHTDLTIGGVGYPIIYSLGKELNSNVYWDDSDISLIEKDADITPSLYAVLDSCYSDYLLKVLSTSTNKAIYIPLLTFTSTNIVNSFFSFIIFKAISGTAIKMGMASKSDSTFTKYQGISITSITSSNHLLYTFLTDVVASAIINMYFYIELPAASEFHFYISSIRLKLNTYTFDLEHSISQEFAEVKSFESTISNGRKIKSIRGWRPKIKLSYGTLLSLEEDYRSSISEAKILGVVPKSDSYTGFVCQWEGDFKRSYLNEKHIGYQGELSLESIYLLKIKPSYSNLIEDNSSSFSLWFLPSKDALNAMYNELYLYTVGGFLGQPYWSSSEYIGSATTAWAINFGDGTIYNNNKYYNCNVRACRAFISTTIYALRDTGPAGGLIFWKSGNNYLEVALIDQSSSQVWSNIIDIAIGITAQGLAVGDGLSNTLAIISQVGHTSGAAKLCNDLNV